MGAKVIFPSIIGDGRIDSILKAVSLTKTADQIEFDFSRTTSISPAGLPILACIADSIIEQQKKPELTGISPALRKNKIIKTFLAAVKLKTLPAPSFYNYQDKHLVMEGAGSYINIAFPNEIESKFNNIVDEEILDAARLIINELMVNCVDHSGAERYYLYCGIYQGELHTGVLDMGISIPAKLAQKYARTSDSDYLEMSLKKGISTRRQRPGGMGLYYMTELLKENEGRLTIISRGSAIRRYFKRRKTELGAVKHPLAGTWCFARLRL